MKNQLVKFISAVILASNIFGIFVGVFGFPAETRAIAFVENFLSPSVPVEGDGGYFDQINVQPTLLGDSIIASIINAGVSRSMTSFSLAFTESLNKSATITDPLAYQIALVNSKGFASAVLQRHGADAIPKSAGGDLYNVAAIFENMGINKNMTAEQARRLGIGRGVSPAQQRKQITQMVVGATSLFASSISCNGINTAAIRNTANYLASASAGVLAEDIRASSGIDFYKNMGRLGSPAATPSFWELTFQDLAAQTESEARQAAALEISSPGIKSPQTVDAATGLPKIGSSQNVIRSSQENAIGSIFKSAAAGALSRVPTNSFKAFITYVTKLQIQGLILKSAKSIAGLIPGGGIAGIIGKVLGKLGADAGWIVAAQSYGQYVAEEITKSFVKAAFDRLFSFVFQGTILAEATGCRRPSKKVAFTSNINTAQLNSEAVSGLVFNAIPETIKRGESAVLNWNAGSIGGEDEVTVNLGGFGTVELSGQRTVTPGGTTAYTLTVVKRGFAAQTFSTTVTVEEPGEAVPEITLTAEPLTIQRGDGSSLAWNAQNADEGTTVTLDPLGEVEPFGETQVRPTTTTTYTLTAVVGGETKTASATVTVQVAPTPPPTGLQFEIQPRSLAEPGNVTISWDASDVAGAASVYIDPLAGERGLSGSFQHDATQTTSFTIWALDDAGDVIGGTQSIQVCVGGVCGAQIRAQDNSIKPRQ